MSSPCPSMNCFSLCLFFLVYSNDFHVSKLCSFSRAYRKVFTQKCVCLCPARVLRFSRGLERKRRWRIITFITAEDLWKWLWCLKPPRENLECPTSYYAWPLESRGSLPLRQSRSAKPAFGLGRTPPVYLRLVIASCLTDHSSMLSIGLACSTCLIVVRSSHFTDSNRLQRRIKMQPPGIDHQQSTPLAKLTRQCRWINSAFLQPTHPGFLFFFLSAAVCNVSKSAEFSSSFFKVSN